MYSYKWQLLDTDTVINTKTYTKSERFLLFPSKCLGREEALGGETVRSFFSKATSFSASVYEGGHPESFPSPTPFSLGRWSTEFFCWSQRSQNDPRETPGTGRRQQSLFRATTLLCAEAGFLSAHLEEMWASPQQGFFKIPVGKWNLSLKWPQNFYGFWPLVGEIWFSKHQSWRQKNWAQSPKDKPSFQNPRCCVLSGLKGPAVDVGPVMWEWTNLPSLGKTLIT